MTTHYHDALFRPALESEECRKLEFHLLAGLGAANLPPATVDLMRSALRATQVCALKSLIDHLHEPGDCPHEGCLKPELRERLRTAIRQFKTLRDFASESRGPVS